MSLSSLEYSEQFQQLIRQMHRGMEDRPQYASYIRAQLSGLGSRIATFEEYLVPEIRHHFGDLENLRILDFGCGTGATTVPLAAACSQVVGLDLGASNVAICRQRLKEHGMGHRMQDLVQGDLEKIYYQLGFSM